VDQAGNAYVTGDTSSGDFPTTEGAWGKILLGSNDAFLTKIRVGSSETTLRICLPCILK